MTELQGVLAMTRADRSPWLNEELAAFGKALQPVEATIDTDPIAKDLIAEIRTLSGASNT